MIYAPNGYGKTSLFDGLEYAFKGEVERIVDLIKVIKINLKRGYIS
ncbi:MAG: AAA family ATPase [Blautia massiliensis (ex Durand et al. 2017)]